MVMYENLFNNQNNVFCEEFLGCPNLDGYAEFIRKFCQSPFMVGIHFTQDIQNNLTEIKFVKQSLEPK